MRKNKKRNKFILLLVLLLAVTIGYAAISTVLKLNGTVGVNKHSWDIHWDNVANQAGETPIAAPTIGNDTDGTTNSVVSFSVQLNDFGQYYEFTVDAVNEGDVNAKVASIDLYYDNQIISATNPLPSYAKYTITNPDGTDITMGEVLPKKENNVPGRKTYKVRIEYDGEGLNAADLNSIDDNDHTFGFGVNYTFTRENGSSGGGDTPITRTLALGDYFTLVPDSNSYTIPASETGHDEDVVINPRELTLWRVVGINQNGTYDAVSEYATEPDVYFNGRTGYANYVGVLQDIAAQYAKSGYTVGTRAFGYDGQTLRLTDLSDLDDITIDFMDTPSLNVGVGQEYNNGVFGDTLYLKDTQLVSPFYRTYDNYGLDTGSVLYPTDSACYWVASRHVSYNINDYYAHFRFVHSSLSYTDTRYSYSPDNCGIRPIITIKSNVEIADGTGNKSDPYVFE